MATTELRGPRAHLLEGLTMLNGRGATPEIADAAPGDTGTPYYFLEELSKIGYVERDGLRRVSSGDDANVYRITERGEDALTEHSARGEQLTTTKELSDRIERLEARFESVERRLDEDDVGQKYTF